MQALDQNYWQTRYEEKNTPWDIGHVSPPLMNLMDGLSDKEMRILIPGAGRAYEAVYLHRLGFQHVFVCDWAIGAFEYLKEQAPDFPEGHLLNCDFFALTGNYDLIMEQTFFCAISPSLRGSYVAKVASLLDPGGILAGLLFAQPFAQAGPPFGGTEKEYRLIFSNDFEIICLEAAKNSILPRAQNELFFKFIKK